MARLPAWLPLPLLIVILLALGLRLPLLNESLWLDEAAQVLESARPFSEQLAIIPDFQPPLLHYLVHFSLYISQAEWWLRLIAAVIPGIITIWAVYQIGRQLHSSGVGLLAALFLATSSFHIFYSQELRPYAFPAMVATLSWWWILKYQKPLRSQKQLWAFAGGWTGLSLLGWYSSYLYPFLWLSQVGFLWLHYRQAWRALLGSSLATLTGFAIWLPIFLQQLAAGQELRVALPGWQSIVSFSQLKTLPLVLAKFLFGVINVELNALFLISTLAIVSLSSFLVWPLVKKFVNKPQLPSTVSAVIIWLILPLAAAWLLSFLIPVIQPKRVLFLLPAGYLAISWLILQTKHKALGQSLAVLVLGLNLFSTAQYYTNPLYQRENWRALQQTLSSHYPFTTSLAIFTFPEPFAPWRWYDQGQFATLSLGYLNSENEAEIRDQLKSATQYQYLITFDYLGDLTDPDNLLEDELQNLGYQTVEIVDYPNIGFVRIWARQGVTVSLFSGTIESSL